MGFFSVLILIAALVEPTNNHKTETGIILLSILGFAYFFSNFLSKDQGLRSLFIWFCALVLVLICRKARELFHHRKNNPTVNPISNDNLGAEVNNSDTDTTNHRFNASPEHVTDVAVTSLEVEFSRLNADVSGNYLTHTQGKRHQTNLAKRAAREAKDAPTQPQPHKRKLNLKKTVKIGRPRYRVTKQFDPDTKQRSLLFQIEYPEIEDLAKPRHRFMSSYEQRVQPFDKRYQYLLFAAEPYETISLKVPSSEIDKSTPKFFSHWDPDSKMFTLLTPELLLCLQLQLYFKIKPLEVTKPQPPASTPNGTTTPGVPPRPMPSASQAPLPPPPPPTRGLPPGAPLGNPPRAPPPPMSGSMPPPPPMSANGPRPVPGAMPPLPPPAPLGARPPSMPPPHP
ncbi:Splicing factor 3A subunit 2, variant 2 [Lathyrus oleraceus]|uniref:Splicing factor 3A subunit 2, variant 2 n=1 Tax=Pisum sativum TaxID=3888 RepID=A0A9D5BF90_PEA|nr:Splicing factor 3A subunit 2, variant 2 [Pisum sativum]